MRCSNPHCSRPKTKGFFGRMSSQPAGTEIDGKWYCSRECYTEHIVTEYRLRKANNEELRTRTFPVTAQAFGVALIRLGKITWQQMDSAMDEKRSNGNKPLAHYLFERGLINRKDILEALGKHHRVPVASIGERTISRKLLGMIPGEVARLGGVVPMSYNINQNRLCILMKDPSDLTTLLTVRKLAGCDVQPFQGDPAEIDKMLERYDSGMPATAHYHLNYMNEQVAYAH